MALKNKFDNLLAWYSHDEASGAVLDSHTAERNLTEFNTVARAPGLIGNASKFTAADFDYYQYDGGTALHAPNGDWTIAFWIKDWASMGAVTTYAASAFGSGSNNNFYLARLSSGRLQFTLYHSDGSATPLNSVVSPPLTAGWDLITAWRTATAMFLQINDNAPVTVANTKTHVDAAHKFRLSNNTNGLNVEMDEVSVWSAVLTEDERLEYYNGGAGVSYTDVAPAIYDGLVAWWDMEEESGVRADSHASVIDLTDNNTVGFMAGHVGTNAADFISANNEYLSSVSTVLETEDQWTVAFWGHNLGAVPAANIIGRFVGLAATREWVVYNVGTTLHLYAYRDAGGGVDDLSAISPVHDLASPGWNLVILEINVAAGVQRIYVDNDAGASMAHLTQNQGGVGTDFRAGGGMGSPFDGGLGPVGMWNRVLTAAERTQLWNAGLGVSYADIAPTLTDGLWAAYEMDEASGQALDSHTQALHLTDVNTTQRVAGLYGNAAFFETANNEYFSSTDPLLSIANIGQNFTFSFWVKDGGSTQAIARPLSKYGATGADREWYMELRNYGTAPANVQLDTTIWYNAVGGVNGRSTAQGLFSVAGWDLVVMWRNDSTSTMNIQVNNGTIYSAAVSGPANSGPTSVFTVGAMFGVANNSDITMDNVFIWNRVLTAAERTEIYNGGDGVSYDGLTATPSTTPLRNWFTRIGSTRFNVLLAFLTEYCILR